MPQLTFHYEQQSAEPDAVLEVRSFVITERISEPYRIDLWLHAARGGLDLGRLVAHRASFSIDPDESPALVARRWDGVVAQARAVRLEPTGTSYLVSLVPALWLLGERVNHRVFQHQNVHEIARAVLTNNGESASFRLSASYEKLAYRVQYAERDLAFFQRILEEGGLAYYFQTADGALVVHDAPHHNTQRARALSYLDNPSATPPGGYATALEMSEAAAATSIAVVDYDFRNPGFDMTTRAHTGSEREERTFRPGYSVAEDTRAQALPAADDQGRYRGVYAYGKARAEREREGRHRARRYVHFETNVIDLSPGVVFAISDHVHPELAPEKRFLAIGQRIEGSPAGAWFTQVQAAFADDVYRPLLVTPRPIVHGPESALVVGPSSDEIHVDEYGRVRVQFFWDAQGQRNEHSSCWVRVCDSWAGKGYGMTLLPRVGHEVLVSFLGGDPDQPVVTGRLHNQLQPVVYELPQQRAVSGWRSHSTPNGHGDEYNEIKFVDDRHHELFHVQAQRDLHKLVKRNENITVRGSRSSGIGSVDSVNVGTRHTVVVAQPSTPPPTIPPTEFTMVDKRITLTTGQATVVLDGPDIYLTAKGDIALVAEKDISLTARHGDIRMFAKRDIVMESHRNLSCSTKNNVSVDANVDVRLHAGRNLIGAATKPLALSSGESVSVTSPGLILVESSAGDVQILGGPKVKLNTR